MCLVGGAFDQEMKKIIALSSTHGTGKSSLAYSLCAKMKMRGDNVVVLDELARRCPFEINKGASLKTQKWIICKQIIEELELMEKFDYIIVDRGVMDGYCYGMVLNMSSLKPFYHVLTNHINDYYHRIYVPDMNSFNFQYEDGTRDLDPTFRKKVYEEILSAYKRFNIRHTIIHKPEDIYEDLKL